MERLKALYPDSSRLVVLVNREEELLLLLDGRHAKFEKQDLTFINRHSLKTDLTTPTTSDVVRLVRPLNVDLYSTDVESIVEVPGGYEVSIRQDCLIHTGKFKIKYREYANEG